MGQIPHDSPNGSSIYVRELSVNWPGGWTSTSPEPYMWMRDTIPTTGWYLFNLDAYHSASSVNFTSTSLSYRTFPAISGNNDHPHALYLAAGSHYFYWVFNSWAYVYELRVDAI
jgi:hypothetical protein